MFNTYRKIPYWRTRLCDVDEALDNAKIGEVHTLCKSAGGRDIRYITYGEKPNYNSRANYSSACGALNGHAGNAMFPAKDFADREGKRPTILIFGATHGQETEGVCGLLNLISLLETGRDLRGEEVPSLLKAYRESNCRLVIIPVYNVDGRVRSIPDSFLEEPEEVLRYYGQGTWKDGSLCGWPECKTIHPIKDAAGYLGAYYNDDGINLMHDNFFNPMAEETKALMALAANEAPECAIGLHGGSNSTNVILQPSYVPLQINEGVFRLASCGARLAEAQGLPSAVIPVSTENKRGAPSFNLTSALHHVCGCVTGTYESNEGLIKKNQFTADMILRHHYCLFESMFMLSWRP